MALNKAALHEKAAAKASSNHWPNCLITGACVALTTFFLLTRRAQLIWHAMPSRSASFLSLSGAALFQVVEHALCLAYAADSLPHGDNEANRLRERVLGELLPQVWPTLMERRVEGSLLAGSLRPHEVEWYASCSKGVYEMLDPDAAAHVRVEKAAAMSEMLGHITWILAAQVALSCLLELSQDFYQRSLLPGNERLQWEAPAGYIAFIIQAADLAMAPRPVLAGRPRHSAFLEMTTLPQETMLTRDLRHVASTCSPSNTLFYPLCAVWRRWEASGVLARRSEEGGVAQMGEVLDQLRPTCALPGCGRREEGLKKCGA